jgi:hypothetical protein
MSKPPFGDSTTVDSGAAKVTSAGRSFSAPAAVGVAVIAIPQTAITHPTQRLRAMVPPMPSCHPGGRHLMDVPGADMRDEAHIESGGRRVHTRILVSRRHVST